MSASADTFLAAIDDAATISKARPSLESFMARSIAMEPETRQCYDKLADIVKTDNKSNSEVVKLYRTMAGIERKHAGVLFTQMGWSDAPPASVPKWNSGTCEGPEASASEELNCLVQPYHALQIALRNEEGAVCVLGLLAAEWPLPGHFGGASDRPPMAALRHLIHRVPPVVGSKRLAPDLF